MKTVEEVEEEIYENKKLHYLDRAESALKLALFAFPGPKCYEWIEKALAILEDETCY